MVMKHIKLFENWAEEIEVPWYSDPLLKEDVIKHDGQTTYHILSDKIQDLIKNPVNNDLNLSNNEYNIPNATNFKSFSDYDFWNMQYDNIRIGQYHSKVRLEDCLGIPQIENKLSLWSNEIKSLRGLENYRFIELDIFENFIENLKYCPNIQILNVENSPLLSFYGSPTNIITNYNKCMCGRFTYNTMIEKHKSFDVSFTLEELKDTEMHANIFTNFDEQCSDTSNISRVVEPWHLIYNDPNDVENKEFLFIPFWLNSEIFRDRSKMMIENLDMSEYERGKEELW